MVVVDLPVSCRVSGSFKSLTMLFFGCDFSFSGKHVMMIPVVSLNSCLYALFSAVYEDSQC